MIKQKFIVFVLIFTILSSAFYLPVLAPTPRAEALFGAGDIVAINIKDFVVGVINGIAQQVAQRMIDEMVKSTVNWAQSGFNGNPAFVTDPSKYYGDIVQNTASNYLNDRFEGATGQSLCAPIQAKIGISLQKYYLEYYGGGYSSQCTFTGIADNLQNFYDGHFTDAGGWDTWFQVTQNASNNPYDQYFIQTEGLAKTIQNAVGIKKEELVSASGFLSKTTCELQNPSEDILAKIRDGEKQGYAHAAMAIMYGEYDLGKTAGTCLQEKTTTPGSVIKDQLDNVLPTGINKLVSVQQIDQLISAFASGLLNKYVFSSQGLLAGDSKIQTQTQKDIDGDNIYDGYDTNNDGILDSCLHGVKDSNLPEGGDNCVGSSIAKNSPYFIPICQTTTDTIASLKVFLDFINRNNFNKNDSYIWTNRTIAASGAVDNLMTTIQRYESPKYDKALSALGKYNKSLDENVKSLAKDGDLATRSFANYIPLGHILGIGHDSDSEVADKMAQGTQNLIKYLNDFNSQALVGRCTDPNADAVDTLDTPDFVTTPDNTTIVPPTTNSVTCSPNKTTAAVGEEVIWTANIAPEAQVTYTWVGLGTQPASAPSVPFTYNKAGEWTASLTANITDASGNTNQATVQCDNPVVVSSSNSTTNNGSTDVN